MTDAERRERKLATARAYKAAHKDELRERRKVYTAAHKDQLKAARKAHRLANQEQTKAQQAAYRESHRDELREKRRAKSESTPTEVKRAKQQAHYWSNRERRCASSRAYSIAHPDRVRASSAAYEAARKPEKIKYNKAYSAANRDKQRAINATKRDERRAYRAQNLDRINKVKAAWMAKNKHRVIANCAKRKAMKIQATPAWANNRAIQDIYKEAARLTQSTGIAHEVDHIYPLRSPFVCGLHCEANLQILTRTANRRKWAYLPEQIQVMPLHTTPHPRTSDGVQR